MKKIRVLIVDDSPFSQMVIKNSLDQTDFEICGVAETGREGIELYHALKPNVVTMDITMPDMDGLVCSEQIMLLDPQARIIVLSSLKDEKLVVQGNSIGVSAFLQKPVKAAELMDTIRQVCGIQHVQEGWQEKYLEYFLQSFQNNLLDMAKLECELTANLAQGGKFTSQGLAIIIGLTGNPQGRMILDSNLEVARSLTQRLLGKNVVTDDDILHGIAEMASIICGHSVSGINNVYKKMELRLTPPSILFGEILSIVNPKLKSFVVTAQTEIGQLNMSVGFAGGE